MRGEGASGEEGRARLSLDGGVAGVPGWLGGGSFLSDAAVVSLVGIVADLSGRVLRVAALKAAWDARDGAEVRDRDCDAGAAGGVGRGS